MLYAGNTLTPAINAARDAGPGEHARFDRLHRLSVRLNGLVLLIGLGLVIAHATRPAPRTTGIVEMTPAERVQYNAEIRAVLDAIQARQGEKLDNPAPGRSGAGAERFPIDEATIRELVKIYAQRRRPPASASQP